MYERLDKLREEVKRCEKRRDDANERLKAAQAKLKEAEASQILSDVGALKLTPEEAFNACTINSAYAMGVNSLCGSISKGKRGSVIITEKIPSLAHIAYYHHSPFISRIIR